MTVGRKYDIIEVMPEYEKFAHTHILVSILKPNKDFEQKFCQYRRKPQGGLSPVEDLQRRLTEFMLRRLFGFRTEGSII